MESSDQSEKAVNREEIQFPEEAKECRVGASWPLQLLTLAALIFIATFLLKLAGGPEFWLNHRIEVLFTLAGIAIWRWAWFFFQNFRAITYRYYRFPQLRREAAAAVVKNGPVPELTILATTYHEKPWITQIVFESVFRELNTIKGLQRTPKVIVVTGCAEDDDNIKKVYDRFYPPGTPNAPELVLMLGDKGKRLALGLGIEAIAKDKPHPDGVVVMMDADSYLEEGALGKILPVFRLEPAVSAVTTNESGRVKGPLWFAEWISLRFGLRHRTMCSIALSGKLLCLTGRLSVFRASVITEESFRKQVECDMIQHWLWGEFAMLSGDDKSTWYWLAKNGHRMLYIPDAMVTTIEVVTGSAVRRAFANVRRWSGNSLRHNWRAMRIGPRKLGWFPWWSLFDQRITMWTVMFGPTVAILGLLSERYELVAGYALWVLCSRVSHASISWRHGRRLSIIYVPLQIISDWAIAATKIWVMFHPAKQNWLNRGKRTLDSTRSAGYFAVKKTVAHYLYGVACAVMIIAVGVFLGFLPVFRDAALFWNDEAETSPALVQSSTGILPVPVTGTLESGPGKMPVLLFGADSTVPPFNDSTDLTHLTDLTPLRGLEPLTHE